MGANNLHLKVWVLSLFSKYNLLKIYFFVQLLCFLNFFNLLNEYKSLILLLYAAKTNLKISSFKVQGFQL